MKKFLIVLFLSFLMAMPCFAAATREASSTSAEPVVLYGKFGNAIVPFKVDASGNLSVAPAGSDTEVQFNDGGAIGAETAFTYNKATNTLIADILQAGQDGTDGSIVIFADQATDRSVTINPHAAMTQDVTYTLPPDDGGASEFLQTDGSGALVWAAVSSATAWDDIGDSDASTAIGMAGNDTTFNVGADIASGDFWTWDGAAAGELTAASGQQNFLNITPDINQSGTATYVGVRIDIAETGVGSGSQLPLDILVDSSTLFRLSSVGLTSISGSNPTLVQDSSIHVQNEIDKGASNRNGLTYYKTAGTFKYFIGSVGTDLMQFQQFHDITSGDAFTFNSAAASELTASSGVQAFVSLDPEIAQSGTGGYIVFKVDSTETSTGSGIAQLMSLELADVAKYTVDTAGTTIQAGGFIGTPESITSVSEGIAASLVVVGTHITTNGDSDLDDVTLANGTIGQLKSFVVKAVGNAADSVKITPATMVGGTQITFAANPLGLGCTMEYTSAGWVVRANNGGTIA